MIRSFCRLLPVAAALATPVLAAQSTASATPAMAFEVASIKPGDPDSQRQSLMMSQGKFETQNQTLLSLIKFAYALNMGSDQQITDGPKWLMSAKFDINAKEDPQTAEALREMTRDQAADHVRLMLRALLADRFKLRVHPETKTLPVYAIVVAKGGLKMTPAVEVPLEPGAKPRGTGFRMQNRGEMEGISATMALFTGVLASQPELGGRTVIDQSGLPGKYNFKLKWTPETGSGGDGAAVDSTAPGLFTALQEQLGIRLDSTRAPVQTIVIDAAEMPSAN